MGIVRGRARQSYQDDQLGRLTARGLPLTTPRDLGRLVAPQRGHLCRGWSRGIEEGEESRGRADAGAMVDGASG
jgi:hypothetical protein